MNPELHATAKFAVIIVAAIVVAALAKYAWPALPLLAMASTGYWAGRKHGTLWALALVTICRPATYAFAFLTVVLLAVNLLLDRPEAAYWIVDLEVAIVRLWANVRPWMKLPIQANLLAVGALFAFVHLAPGWKPVTHLLWLKKHAARIAAIASVALAFSFTQSGLGNLEERASRHLVLKLLPSQARELDLIGRYLILHDLSLEDSSRVAEQVVIALPSAIRDMPGLSSQSRKRLAEYVGRRLAGEESVQKEASRRVIEQMMSGPRGLSADTVVFEDRKDVKSQDRVRATLRLHDAPSSMTEQRQREQRARELATAESAKLIEAMTKQVAGVVPTELRELAQSFLEGFGSGAAGREPTVVERYLAVVAEKYYERATQPLVQRFTEALSEKLQGNQPAVRVHQALMEHANAATTYLLEAQRIVGKTLSPWQFRSPSDLRLAREYIGRAEMMHVSYGAAIRAAGIELGPISPIAIEREVVRQQAKATMMEEVSTRNTTRRVRLP